MATTVSNSALNKQFLSGGVLNINITLSGWDQLLQATQAVQTQFINDVFDPGLSRLNNVLVIKMKEKMHYWTGKRKAGRPHMRDVTRQVHLGTLQYAVTVPVRYAVRENFRPGAKPGFGSHNFVTPSVQETLNYIPILSREWTQWIANNFSKVQGSSFGGVSASTPRVSKITPPRIMTPYG